MSKAIAVKKDVQDVTVISDSAKDLYLALKPDHQRFVDALIKNNYNATQAYLTINDCMYESAKVMGFKLKRDPKIMAVLQAMNISSADRCGVTKDYLYTTLVESVAACMAKLDGAEVAKHADSINGLIDKLNAMRNGEHMGKSQGEAGISVEVEVGSKLADINIKIKPYDMNI